MAWWARQPLECTILDWPMISTSDEKWTPTESASLVQPADQLSVSLAIFFLPTQPAPDLLPDGTQHLRRPIESEKGFSGEKSIPPSVFDVAEQK